MDKLDERFYKKLGERITDLRKKAGYKNQEAFAHDVGISRGQYYKYELGTNMELTSLLKIMKFHKMTAKEFFGEGFE
jgi:transcriptional regulator with XRE-family HTH domain